MKLATRSITLIVFTISAFFSFSQLDSTSIMLSSESYSYLDENNDSILARCVNVETWVNDFDFFGEIVVTVIELENNFPVEIKKLSKNDVISSNSILTDSILIKMYAGIVVGRTYSIEVQVRDYQGLNLPLQTATLLID